MATPKVVLQLPFLDIREDGVLIVKNVRLSYEHVFEPWGKEEGKPKKYSGKFLLPKSTHKAEAKAVLDHVIGIMKDKWKTRLGNDQIFIRDGDALGKEEYAGYYVISASEKADHPPAVIDKDRRPLTPKDDKVYSGAWVNVMINPWAQDNIHGKKVNANLLAVQFKRHDTKFSQINRPDVDEAFADESDEDEGTSPSARADDGFGGGDGFD